MTRILLFAFLVSFQFSIAQNTNLVTNGNMEAFNFPNGTPNGWSSASDFGTFNQNTTDFIEGSSSVQFNPGFSDLMMFTLIDIPLEAGKDYIVKFSYKYLGNVFDSDDNIKFTIYNTSNNIFEHFTSIENGNWTTVETQFSATVSNSSAEVILRVYPSFLSEEYPVLFDDIQIIEATGLSNTDFNLEDSIRVVTRSNNNVKIIKSSDIIISDINLFSILGQQKRINNASADYSSLNLSALSSGIYILKLSTNKGNITKKLLIK